MEGHARRSNRTLAEQVQYGVSLLYVAGPAEARRYLRHCSVPDHIVERVLDVTTTNRRQLGEHSVTDPTRE